MAHIFPMFWVFLALADVLSKRKEAFLFGLLTFKMKCIHICILAIWKMSPRFQSATADDDRLLSVERRFNLSTTMAS